MRTTSVGLSLLLCLLGPVACGGAADEVSSSPDSRAVEPVEAGPGPTDSAIVEADPETWPIDTACAPTDPRSTPTSLSVLPDAGEAPFVDRLQTATKSIRVYGYLMGYGGILDTLTAKAKAGIDVRVILDGVSQRDVNEKYRVVLEAAGAKFQWSDPKFSNMHAKVLVIDGIEALISTGNYSRSYMLKERNYLARITDVEDVRDLVALFDADWTHTAPDLSCTRLIVAPENAQSRLVALVNSATKSIEIESMQFSEREVKEAVYARQAAGVTVRVILANPTWIDANLAIGKELAARGIPTKWLGAPSVHVKAMVIDGVRAYLGSENFSWTSLSKNREVGVFLTEPPAIAAMDATFEKDWSAATTF